MDSTKKFSPRSSEAVLLTAPLLADILWPVSLLLGWEQVRIDPGNTRFTPFDFVSYPWSHSVLMSCVWATAFAAIYFLLTRYWAGAIAIWIGVVSHWVLDWVAHRPDMPLYPGGSAVRARLVELDRGDDNRGIPDVRSGGVDVCKCDKGEGSHRAVCVYFLSNVAAGDLCRQCIRPRAQQRE